MTTVKLSVNLWEPSHISGTLGPMSTSMLHQHLAEAALAEQARKANQPGAPVAGHEAGPFKRWMRRRREVGRAGPAGPESPQPSPGQSGCAENDCV